MSTPITGPLADDAALHLLADHLVAALDAEEIEPSLLHVGLGTDGFDLGVRPLEGHPTDALLGFVAPPEWHALGLATHGWAYHLSERGSTDRRRHRVHVVTLVTRTGEHAHRTLVSGDLELQCRLADEDPSGEQIDLLHRSLGMATTPPPCDAAVYWSIEWLAALVTETQPPPPTWEACVARHPAMHLLDRQPDMPTADAVDVLAGFHRVCDWSRLRELTAEAAFRAPDLRAEHARWLDDGAFARFLLNRCPPLATLRRRAEARLPRDIARRLHHTFDELEVPWSAWPDVAPPARSAT